MGPDFLTPVLGVAAAVRGEQLERRSLGVLATGRDGVIVHGADGRVIDVNDAAAYVLDRSRADLLRHHVGELPVTWITEDNRT
ncbi:MAG TPA: PAS domain-containing protein, partial [Actinotalea sp.]|nr:PAS domain-containing protein [Actinotalea sp.]